MDETNVGLSALPERWVWTRVNDIAEFIRGVSYRKHESSKTPEADYIPILRANNINVLLNYEDLVYVRREKIKDEQFVKAFDIIIAMSSGSKNLVGKAAQSYQDYQGGFGTFCGLVRISSQLDRKFVGLFFQSSGYRNEISRLSSGMNINNLRRQHIESMFVPIPPLPQQHRIVAKIEELFTKLDAGKEELLQAKARLKRYRQSVLKAAMEGKLTADWRKKHGDEIEPASILLDRILKERREKWEAEQLKQMRTKGKMPKDDKWTNKYKEPLGPDTSKLPELPKGWVWTTVSSIGLVASGQTPKGINDFDSKGKIPFYKISDMNKSGNEKFMRATAIALDDVEIERLRIHVREQGTVIFPKRGGAIATNKKRILSCPSTYDLNIMGVLPYIVPTDFFYQWLLSIDLATLSDGSNVPQLNHKHIDPLPFALPSLPEQHRIVSEVEHRLSVADAVEATVDAELKRSDALRQSILKQAFSGKLVPQDPNDEPAEKLLERIKEGKMERETKQKSKRKPKKTKKREQGFTKIDDLLAGKTRDTRIYDALKSVGQPLPSDELLELSRLDVDEFYAQLKAEVESGRIVERRPDKMSVFLEIKNEA